MGLQINTNVAALNSYRNLTNTQGSMQTSLERLSSGLRINRAADDAAGLAISENLRSQVNGLNQATANAQDGISMVQTAEGAMNEVHSMLQRMRTLAVQAANGTNSSQNQAQIQAEVDQLVSEITMIESRTNFNGTKLLQAGSMTLQVGANQGDVLAFSLGDLAAVKTALASFSITGADAISTLDAQISAVSTSRSNLGAVQNRLEHTIKNLSVSAENLAASESRIRDTDMAKEMTNFTRSQILQQAGTAMLAQANQSTQGVLRLLG